MWVFILLWPLARGCRNSSLSASHCIPTTQEPDLKNVLLHLKVNDHFSLFCAISDALASEIAADIMLIQQVKVPHETTPKETLSYAIGQKNHGIEPTLVRWK